MLVYLPYLFFYPANEVHQEKLYIILPFYKSKTMQQYFNIIQRKLFFYLANAFLLISIRKESISICLHVGRIPCFLFSHKIIWIYQFTLINNLIGNFNKDLRACSYVKVLMSNLVRSHWWYSTANQEGIAANAYLRNQKRSAMLS